MIGMYSSCLHSLAVTTRSRNIGRMQVTPGGIVGTCDRTEGRTGAPGRIVGTTSDSLWGREKNEFLLMNKLWTKRSEIEVSTRQFCRTFVCLWRDKIAFI